MSVSSVKSRHGCQDSLMRTVATDYGKERLPPEYLEGFRIGLLWMMQTGLPQSRTTVRLGGLRPRITDLINHPEGLP